MEKEKKDLKRLEREFRDAYAKDPAGFMWEHLNYIHHRIDRIEHVLATVSPAASGILALLAELERLREGGEK